MGSQKVGRFNVFIARMASAIAIANGSNEKVRHRFNKIATKNESTKKTWFENHHLKLDWIIFDMTLTENILARLLFQSTHQTW